MNSLAGTNSAAGGNTPNWATGYVPSASEWNAWWGAKLDTTGGVLNGTLTVDALDAVGVAATTVSASSSISTPILGLSNGWTLLSDGFTNDLYSHSSGNYDAWVRSNGTRIWVANGTSVMTLDAVGNLTVPLSIIAKAFSLSSGFALAQDASNNDIYEHSSGNYDVWIRSNGSRGWVSNNIDIMGLDANGNLILGGSLNAVDLNASRNLFVNGDLSTVGVISCGGVLSIASQQVSDFNMYRLGPSRVLQWGAGANIVWSETDGSVSWNTPTLQTMKLDATGNLAVEGIVSSNSVVATTSLHLASSLVIFTNPGGDHILQHASSSQDVWQTANSVRTWSAANAIVMTLDASGNLAVPGTVHGSNVTTMQETIDELQALVQDLQTRLGTLEAQSTT